MSHADIRESLDRGDVDLGLSVFGELSPWHCSSVLYEQGYGCLFDGGFGRYRDGRLTLSEYLAARQVIVTFDGKLSGKIDRALAGRTTGGKTRQRDVRFGTTRFAALPHLVRGTDLIASIPELIGRVLARTHGLSYCPLPFAVPPGHPQLAWHRRNDVDPANRWLRDVVTASVRATVVSVREAAQTKMRPGRGRIKPAAR